MRVQLKYPTMLTTCFKMVTLVKNMELIQVSNLDYHINRRHVTNLGALELISVSLKGQHVRG